MPWHVLVPMSILSTSTINHCSLEPVEPCLSVPDACLPNLGGFTNSLMGSGKKKAVAAPRAGSHHDTGQNSSQEAQSQLLLMNRYQTSDNGQPCTVDGCKFVWFDHAMKAQGCRGLD